MRIAFIGSRGFPGFNAGVEKSLEEICPRLAERGHEVTLYCSDQVTTDQPVYKKTFLKRTAAIPSKHFETLSRTVLSAWDALFKNYDIVHFHSIGPALLSWMTKLGSCKTVVTVHGLDWQRAKWGKFAQASLKAGEKAAAFFPDKTIVVSKHLKRYFKGRYGKEVDYIPNGVHAASPLPARLIREKWGLEPKDYVLFISRLVPEKECHTLIRAFRDVKTDKKLVIAGASWYSDDYVEKLKKMAEGDSRVLFTGWVEGESATELFSNAYLFCLPSKIEGLSLALLEAMSFGLCPLVSDIPENTDVTGENGVSFQTGNVLALAARLQELVDHPERTAALGEAAKKSVVSEYSWERNCRDLESVYASLLDQTPVESEAL